MCYKKENSSLEIQKNPALCFIVNSKTVDLFQGKEMGLFPFYLLSCYDFSKYKIYSWSLLSCQSNLAFLCGFDKREYSCLDYH